MSGGATGSSPLQQSATVSVVRFWRPYGWAFFIPALLYMLLIFYLSSNPAPPYLSKWPVWWGIKSAHLLEYGILSSLLIAGFQLGTTASAIRSSGYAIVLALLWGISDEWHQSFYSFRTARALDIVADLIAALFCAIVFLLGQRLRVAAR
jgi:VanZ family protein